MTAAGDLPVSGSTTIRRIAERQVTDRARGAPTTDVALHLRRRTKNTRQCFATKP
jgi:hypothetical protein